MSDFAAGAGSFAVAAAVSFAATPVAIRIAKATDFLDRPRQYRKHAAPTPFLGGGAVLVGVVLASLVLAGVTSKLLVPLGCAIALWVIGTIDDRIAVRPIWRVLAESGAAAALVAVGLGWSTSLPGAGDFALTIIWVVGVVNAFNLMDNLDGACSTVAFVSSAGIGGLAVINGEPVLAAMAFALAGACAGFLPWNLARPAKIFLGDGGSMPVGFLVAALAMAVTRQSHGGPVGVLAGALLAGLPIFDVTLVSFSRTRRGVSITTGGRDHLTHRLLLALRSPRVVAVALAVLQGMLSLTAILGHELGDTALELLGLAVFLIAAAAIPVLDGAVWRPAGIAIGSPEQVPTVGSRHIEEVRTLNS